MKALKQSQMSNSPTEKSSWQKLTKLASELQTKRTVDLFDESRVQNFTIENERLVFDYSKQKVTSDVRNTLIDLLKESDFESKRDAMFNGDAINHTEGRAVLHTALRRPETDSVSVKGENIIPVVHHTLMRIKEISDQLQNGTLQGATGKIIDTVISIGIGGSDLGPRMICQALKSQYQTKIKTHFVSNIDGEDIQSTIKQCNPETSLIIVISKSFTTQETLTNAITAREWLTNALPEKSDSSMHYLCVSANVKAAKDFGITEHNIYPMWDWVNGRFSLWSAVGISISLSFGFDVFRALLDGAYEADQNFFNNDFDQNIAILLALLGIWNVNFLGHNSHALLPYTEKLKYMPAYIQQLEMESNGKTINNQGDAITDYNTCPVIFGEVGTNGQHSFYQLLHQGTQKVPCDFIGILKDDSELAHHHKLLLSHMLAQGQAMLQGRQNPDQPYRYFDGDIPSTTMLFHEMSAKSLGYLIALYEHKTFTQGVIWNVNSFDQFGVELGKELAKKLESEDVSDADPSTKSLFSKISSFNG
ncbi:MAG: glucose-6-phosphate isomerase [Pseudomonadota bacterium]